MMFPMVHFRYNSVYIQGGMGILFREISRFFIQDISLEKIFLSGKSENHFNVAVLQFCQNYNLCANSFFFLATFLIVIFVYEIYAESGL